MKPIIILGHDNPDVDSIFSGVLLEGILNRSGKDAKFLIFDKNIDKDTKIVCEKFGIHLDSIPNELPTEEVSYILVDHHSRDLEQSPIAIYDHHPDDCFVTDCGDYVNKKACSTSCILGRMYEESLTRDDVLLILVSALVDTASFHSIKTVPGDVEWLKELCNKFSINMEDYYKDGLCLTDISSIEEASFHGLKKYQIEGKRFESSFIQVEDLDKIDDVIKKIIGVLQDYVQSKSLYEFAFIAHDMSKFQSTVYHIFPNKIDIVQYGEYISRGNIIIPEITKKIIEQSKKRS